MQSSPPVPWQVFTGIQTFQMFCVRGVWRRGGVSCADHRGTELTQSRARDLPDHALRPPSALLPRPGDSQGAQAATGSQLVALFPRCKNRVQGSLRDVPGSLEIDTSAGAGAPLQQHAGRSVRQSCCSTGAAKRGQMLPESQSVPRPSPRPAKQWPKKTKGSFSSVHKTTRGLLALAPAASFKQQMDNKL